MTWECKVLFSSDALLLQEEGEENPGFEEDEEPVREEDGEDFEEDPKFKKILETISENQNSPYSTQASHNNSR